MLDNKRILEKKMKSLKNLLVSSLTIVGFLLAVTTAKADPLTITLAQPFQSIAISGTLDFVATITNNTGETEYLNGDDFTIQAPLTLDDSPYIVGYPLTLGAGDSYTGLLFIVTVPPGTPQTLYEGNFEITGGYNDSDDFELGSADFDVNVTPEPSSLSLLGLGLLTGLIGFAGTLRRLIA